MTLLPIAIGVILSGDPSGKFNEASLTHFSVDCDAVVSAAVLASAPSPPLCQTLFPVGAGIRFRSDEMMMRARLAAAEITIKPSGDIENVSHVIVHYNLPGLR